MLQAALRSALTLTQSSVNEQANESDPYMQETDHDRENTASKTYCYWLSCITNRLSKGKGIVLTLESGGGSRV